MGTLLDRGDAPGHLFDIRELDFSGDLFGDPLAGQWFRLGARTITPHRDERGVEDVISRQSLLVARASFEKMFDRLESVGNVIGNLGKPGGWVLDAAGRKEYRYAPFHRFEISSTWVSGEPVVFIHHVATGTRLLINPDLWLFFELKRRRLAAGFGGTLAGEWRLCISAWLGRIILKLSRSVLTIWSSTYKHDRWRCS